MSAVRPAEGKDTFEVDLGQLATEGLLGRARRLIGSEDTEATPELIGRAVRAVMGRCRQRHVDGRPLVWNVYTIFLSTEDHETLRPLERALSEGLLSALEDERTRLGADVVGPLDVLVRCDRDAALSAGFAVIRAHFEQGRPEASAAPSDQTLRAPEPLDGVEPTRRVAEHEGGLRLSWLDQSVSFPVGQTLLIGRPHPGAPLGFVPLQGADSRVNRVQLQISADADAVTFVRPDDANPVQVDGALISRGARLVVVLLPVTITLSAGALTLRLERR